MIKDMIDKQVMELKKLWANKRQLTFQVLNLAMIVFSALMIWKGLMFVTKVCIVAGRDSVSAEINIQ
jgi:signal peptidase